MALPLLAIAGGVLVLGGFAQNAMHIFPPLWNAWQKFAFSLMPNINPQVAELIEMRWRDIISEEEYIKRSEQFGFSEQVSANLLKASSTLLTMHDNIALWRRGVISESECDNQLHKMRLDSEQIERAKTVTLFFPTAPDLIRFAVREVYTPSIVEKFGALQDLPEQYLQEASRAGLTQEHAKQYWAAHWELPSAQMGFQMLHRRIIDEDSLKLLLRALDVMPFWRDALVKLSYNPLTRVDVRRMYRLGVLNEEQVNDAYLDRGYSPKNAELMTEFTVAYEADELTGITRASVMSSYKKGIITLEALKKYLEGFGYAPGVIEFWLSVARHDKEMEVIDAIADEVRQKYLMGLISLAEARSELMKYDLPASFISELLGSLEVKQSQRIKLPSRTDLENWLKSNFINEVEYSLRMERLGYTRADIEMYLTEIAKEVETEKVKYLSQKTYERWFSKQIIGEKRFRQIMVELGRSPADIDNLVRELKPQPE
jgi:hypothetical protein